MFRNYFWARNRLKQLKSGRDTQEIVHLLLEVRYGNPIFQHVNFSITFVQQAAVPSIAKMLYRNGEGQIFKNPAKRVNDTWIYFGELFQHFDNDQGQVVIQQINQAHRHFPIPNHLNLYTLSTMICIPKRSGIKFAGQNVLTKDQFRAIYLFWKRIGELMGIEDIPKNEDALFGWCLQYEQEQYQYTEAGQKITIALAEEFSTRWFPSFLNHLGQQVFYSILPIHLIGIHQIQKPNPLVRWMTLFLLRLYVKIILPICPDPKDRKVRDYFGKDYPTFNIRNVGYDKKMTQ